MKPVSALLLMVILMIGSTVTVFGASSAEGHGNGAITLVFLGFCAFVVVAQLLPAIVTLWGMITGMTERKKAAGARK